MRKILLIGLGCFLLSACTQNTFTSATKQQIPTLGIPAEAHIQRIVCFKFKEGTSPEAFGQILHKKSGRILKIKTSPCILQNILQS